MKKLLLSALFCTILALTGCPSPENTDDSGGYRVEIGALSGGVITASPQSGPEGTEITLEVKVDTGRRLAAGSLVYQYADGSNETRINTSTKKFRMPASDVMINAEFEAWYQVNIPEALRDLISADPPGGPEGTEIHLTFSLEGDAIILGGSLKYSNSITDTVIDTDTAMFTLPPSDVTVSAVIGTWDSLIRRMVPVAGGRITKAIGAYGGPFADATRNPVDIASFNIAAVELPYQLWWTVKNWAMNEKSGERYHFLDNFGREGDRGGHENYNAPTEEHRYEPVTNMTWLNAMVWCNAYSEWTASYVSPGEYGYDFEPVYKSAADAPQPNTILRSSILTDLHDALGGTATSPDLTKIVFPANNAPGFRLPANAEWEFAARGGESAAPDWSYIYAGSNTIAEVAWYGNNSSVVTHQVGAKLPNRLGIYDMSGNVEEITMTYPPVAVLVFFRGGNMCAGINGVIEECSLSYPVAGYEFSQSTVVSSNAIRKGFRVAGPYRP